MSIFESDFLEKVTHSISPFVDPVARSNYTVFLVLKQKFVAFINFRSF